MNGKKTLLIHPINMHKLPPSQGFVESHLVPILSLNSEVEVGIPLERV
jgi:hypothetical protein